MLGARAVWLVVRIWSASNPPASRSSRSARASRSSPNKPAYLGARGHRGTGGRPGGCSSAHHNRARIGKQLKRDRNDYNTEFGPTNVELHAVAVAVDLGDAGEALELAADIDARQLSPERQARFLVDVGRAHTQRRHVGEATAALLEAEKLAPEHVRGHQSREAINDLLHIAERRASEDLLGLARRAGVA
jgi:hypothetical protein